ncbi:small ubiquitin-related modifier 2 [Artemisia annua]|uniref:Small ubiquitin-related modifier 2 n=1 Tax=Artemisia annua TaxID=35608 RepID=A0A2U1MK36_ARTAN|nr:small ubiquitin-related modifier 2 [Artemisia annua]
MDQGAHINLKVKSQDGNDVFFKIKRSTQLKKQMNAFLFDVCHLRAEQTPDEFSGTGGRIRKWTKAELCRRLLMAPAVILWSPSQVEAQLVLNWTPPINELNGANRSLPPKIQEGLDKQKGEQNHGKEKNVSA